MGEERKKRTQTLVIAASSGAAARRSCSALYTGVAVLLLLLQEGGVLEGTAAVCARSAWVAMLFVAAGVRYREAMASVWSGRAMSPGDGREAGWGADKNRGQGHGVSASSGAGAILDAAHYLLIPYAWFSLLRLVVYSIGLIADRGGRSVDGLILRLFQSLTLCGMESLWILPAMFLSLALYHILWTRWRPHAVYGLSLAVYALYAGVSGAQRWNMYYLTSYTPVELPTIGVQLMHFLWRGVLGLLFLGWGSILYDCARAWKRLRRVGLGVALLLAGAVAAASYGPLALEKLQLTGSAAGQGGFMGVVSAFVVTAGAAGLSGGIYLLCTWIDTVRPIDALGRYAMLIYLALTQLGILRLAVEAGDAVFARADHNFLRRVAVLAVASLLSGLAVAILRLPPLRFVHGGRVYGGRGRREWS